MKKVIYVMFLLFNSFYVFAQAPQRMSYQAVIRNSSNNLVANSAVRIRISILQGSVSGAVVFSETHAPTSNANGLVSIEIGGGTNISGSFSNINWANGPFFIRTETDPTGGTNYTISATTQLLSVPYALFSGNGLPNDGSQNQTLSWCNGVATWGPCMPVITSTQPINITASTAVSGGTISSDRGNAIIAKGVVWSTSPAPTVALTTKTNDGSGMGSFTSNISGLQPSTSYYIRAYATNSAGTGYGNEFLITTPLNTTHSCGATNIHNNLLSYGMMSDQDGNLYKTIKIGTQTWMAENLKVSRYQNGDIISEVKDPQQWRSLTTGATCWYNNDSVSNSCPYGRLYNYYVVIDSRKVCPTGWRIPNNSDWSLLINTLGGTSLAGGEMKSTGSLVWASPNTGASNNSGFSAVAGGLRRWDGVSFDHLRGFALIWSASLNTYYDISSTTTAIRPFSTEPGNGLSIRCIKE